MADTVTGKKKLVVLLGGIIGYVPDGGGLWALMPDATVPKPAQWKPMGKLLAARSPHYPLLLVDGNLIDEDQTTGKIDAYFRQGKARYDHCVVPAPASTELAAILFLGERLDFKLPSGKFEICPRVDRYFPQMAEISAKHKYVARRFNPLVDSFNEASSGLSAAFKLSVGKLEVASLFGEDRAPQKVAFGYVCSNILGFPDYQGRVWKRELANKLRWTVCLPDDQEEVVITSKNWLSGGGSSDYVFKIPPSGDLLIEIVHSEVEVPAFFLKDPILSADVEKIPDPDFEVLYNISTAPARGKLRVPVPRSNSGSGAVTKPCAGGFFEAFR